MSGTGADATWTCQRRTGTTIREGTCTIMAMEVGWRHYSPVRRMEGPTHLHKAESDLVSLCLHPTVHM